MLLRPFGAGAGIPQRATDLGSTVGVTVAPFDFGVEIFFIDDKKLDHFSPLPAIVKKNYLPPNC